MSDGRRAGTLGPAPRWEALALPVLALIAAFASIAHLYPRGHFPSYDFTSYLFVADGMLKGRIPYVQLWENKGLPLYALDALGRLITPGRYTGVWLLELVFTWFAFWGVLWTLRRFASFAATALASGLLVLGIVMTAVGGNTPEFWSLALQASGLVVAWLLISGEWRSKRWLLLLTGAAAGVAGMMKLNLLGTWVALFGLLVALAVARRIALSDAARVLGLMAAGFFAAVAVSMAPILTWGATQAWWDQWIVFGVNMTKYGFGGERVSGLAAARVGLDRIMFVSATLVAGVIAAAVGWFVRGRPRVDSQRAWMAAFLGGWLGVELWASTVNGLTYTHYSMPWLIPAVALIALLFGGATVRWPAWAFAGAVVALSLWYSAPAFRLRLDFSPGFPPVVRHEDDDRHVAQEQMIREVEARTDPTETVFIWGMDPIVFAETGRLSAGPYAHPLDILLTPGYQSEARFSAFMDELKARPPRLIIDSSFQRPNRPSIPELAVSEPTATSYGLVQPYMRALPEFVAARYRHVVSATPRVEYYELIGD